MYLILTSAASIIFLGGDFLRFFNESGQEIFLNYRGTWVKGPEEVAQMLQSQIIIPVICILIIALSLVAVFLFKNRKLQIKFSIASVILSAVLTAVLAWYAYSTARINQAAVAPGFRMFLPPIILLFSILAWLGIRRDENLVRSYDRLR